MFCCGSDTLYYSVIEVDPYEILFEEESVPLSIKLKKNIAQVLLPKSMHLVPENAQFIYINSPMIQYEVSFSEQTRQLNVKELVKQPEQKLWRVLLQNQEQNLTEGDYFSFDGFQFQVYHLPKKMQNLSTAVSYLIDGDDRCRICFGDDTCQKNPLLNFCNCSGSIKFMHLDCCRSWIKQGAQIIAGQNYAMYVYEKVQCNICKDVWKNKIKHNKKEYCLFDFQPNQQVFDEVIENSRSPMANYIMFSMSTLDYQSEVQDSEVVQYFLIVKITIPNNNNPKDEYSFKIGKSQEQCEIVLSQFVIQSPVQCEFKFKNNKLYIKDLNSVDGTNVFLKNLKQKSFCTKKGLLLRLYNTVFQIKGKNNWFSCFQPQITYHIKYQEYKQAKSN